MKTIGKSVHRKESWDKVTGKAKYTGDYVASNALYVAMVKSEFAHAKINKIYTNNARQLDGVRAIILGGDLPLIGEEVIDRPALAWDKVRYYGEVIALVVADNYPIAKKAAALIEVQYELLPVVHSPSEALKPNAPILHEGLELYQMDEGIYPEKGTNIINRTKIRKGDIEQGFAEAASVIEASFALPISDHIAMETRNCTCEISSDGYVYLRTSSQAPYMVKQIISRDFGIETGEVIVETPLVGGGYGGKASVQLEIYAYLASKAVGGRKVQLSNSREEDLMVSPVHIGLEADVKIGCDRNGQITATKIEYRFDGGAYADKSPHLSTAGAVDCTGPYKIEHIWCDSLCVYTNHPYASPYRGFSHGEVHFAFERAVDILAKKVGIDPLQFRIINGIRPGNTTPTQVVLNNSTVGNVHACLTRLKDVMKWEEKGQIQQVASSKYRVKGISCSWKNSTIGPKVSSGVLLTFNSDGSINLISGLVEIGTGTKTVLAQILAEKMKMDVHRIHVKMPVNTQTDPEHWKTVASRGTFMAGRAVLSAADDAIMKLKKIGSIALRADVSDLAVANERVFIKDSPEEYIDFKDLVYGYSFPNGNTMGGQITAVGTYNLRGLTSLNKETGAGNPGPEWTVAAQGVELEVDVLTYTYTIMQAVTVVDIGEILNFQGALGQIKGAMNMGIEWACREAFYFDEYGRLLNNQLRTYRPLRINEKPTYVVDFVKTPQLDAPYGGRGAGEHGLIGIPAAIGNALSHLLGVELTTLPLTPESIWKQVSKEKSNEL